MVLSAPPNTGGGDKKRWSNLLPLFVTLVVVQADIAFLGRLDMAKNAALVHHWTTSFYFPSTPSSSSSSEGSAVDDEEAKCRDWLEREDAVTYERDFRVEPVLVSGVEQVIGRKS